MQFKAVELLCGVIAKSRAPRATVSAAFWKFIDDTSNNDDNEYWRYYLKICLL